MKEITHEKFQKKIDKGEKFIIVYHGSWCNPCHQMITFMKEMIVEREDTKGCKFYISDAVENKFSSGKNLRILPTIQIYNKGKLMKTIEGKISKEMLKEEIC